MAKFNNLFMFCNLLAVALVLCSFPVGINAQALMTEEPAPLTTDSPMMTEAPTMMDTPTMGGTVPAIDSPVEPLTFTEEPMPIDPPTMVENPEMTPMPTDDSMDMGKRRKPNGGCAKKIHDWQKCMKDCIWRYIRRRRFCGSRCVNTCQWVCRGRAFRCPIPKLLY